MALLLEHSSVTGPVPVMEGVGRVHEVLDSVGGGVVGPVSGRDVAEVDRAIARLESLKLRLVAAADEQDAATRAGMSGTSAWLAAHTRSWGGRAAADVSLATALEASLPVTKQALADGAVSTAHASVIAHTTSRLPEALTGEERAKVEAALVAQAKRVDPERLRRSAKRALLAAERSVAEADAHEDAELRSEEARAEGRVRLSMHDNRDGTITGHFTVPTLAGSILRKVIQQMTAPRRRGPGQGGVGASRGTGWCESGRSGLVDAAPTGGGVAAPTGVGVAASAGVGVAAPAGVGVAAPAGVGVAAPAGVGSGWNGRDAKVDWEHRYGQAFVELLEHLDTERLNGKVAATVVTMDIDRLRENLGAAHLDTGHDLSTSEVRRLACSAGVLPAVLNGSSLPLDLGRTNRFFTEAQRVALATTYEECAAEDCDRPYSWCELHQGTRGANTGRQTCTSRYPPAGSIINGSTTRGTTTRCAPTGWAERSFSFIDGRRPSEIRNVWRIRPATGHRRAHAGCPVPDTRACQGRGVGWQRARRSRALRLHVRCPAPACQRPGVRCSVSGAACPAPRPRLPSIPGERGPRSGARVR